MIIQFSTTVVASTTTSVTFPIAYTKVAALVCSLMGASTQVAQINHHAKTVTKTGFTRTDTSGSYLYHWIAIGF